MAKTYEFIRDENLWSHDEYTSVYPILTFVSAMSKDMTVRQRGDCCGCREYFNTLLQKQLMGDENYKIPIKQARIALFIRSSAKNKELLRKGNREFFESVKLSVNAVNILEKKHKWRLTRLYPLINKADPKIFMAMVVGSNKWIRSPHMQSMYCLIIRGARTAPFQGIKTYDDLMSACKQHIKEGLFNSGHIENSYKCWDTIMGNFEKLFYNLSMVKNYDTNTYGDSVYHEGVSRLVMERTLHKELKRRFQKYCL